MTRLSMIRNRYSPSARSFRVAAALAIVAAALSAGCASSPQSREARFLRKGAARLEEKDYSRAVLEFKNAAAAMPGDAEPHYQMGLALIAMGNPASGVAALRKAIELNPKHQGAQLKLAEIMAASRDKETVQEAAGRLQDIVSAAPDNAEANDALALAEWKLGKTEEAVSRLEETLRRFPARLQTSVQLARLRLSQKDLPGAEQVLKQAAAGAAQSADAELALGEFYLAVGDSAKAETELRKALLLDSKSPAALLGLAAIQLAGKRLEEADQTYRKLSSLPGAEWKPQHALFLYRIGKRQEAVAELEALFRGAPRDRAARNRLLAAYRAVGKTEAAQKLIGEELQKNAKDVDALLQRAELSLEAGKAKEAEQDLREVLHVIPESAEAHFALARLYRVRNAKLQERQELNDALQLNPSLLGARLTLARNFTIANQGAAALEILNAAPAGQKDTAAFVAERNWALLSLGETAEAKPVLDRVLRDERIPEFLLQDAIIRLKAADYAGAQSEIQEILQRQPEDLRAMRLLVESYVAQKQPAKAQQRLEAAAAAHPHSAPLADLLGNWYLGSHDAAAARKAFEAAQAADRKFAPSALALADLDRRENHPQMARRRLQQVVADDPGNISALFLLGAMAGEAGDRKEAVDRYRTVVAIDGSNVAALNNLAYTLAFSDPQEALKFAQHAAELAPDNAAVQDTLGWVFYRQALYSSAIPHLEAAVAREATPRRRFHLAVSYLKCGKNDIGNKMLQQALQQSPDLARTEEGW